MSIEGQGIAPIGHLADLPPLDAAVVRFLRMHLAGEAARAILRARLGAPAGDLFAELCETTRRFARRELARLPCEAQVASADEVAFAAMVSAAASGEREDALLIAVCLVRADVAPAVVASAQQAGLQIRRATARR